MANDYYEFGITWHAFNNGVDYEGGLSLRPTFRTIGLPILAGLVILCTVVGNLLLIIGVRFVRRMREPVNYLFVSLAVADTFVGLVVMPIACIYDVFSVWTLGPVACDLWTYFDVMLCTASILHLCAISLDRYLTIRDPLSYAGKRTAKRMCFYIALVWMGAFLVSLPPLCGFPSILADDECRVNPNVFYQVYATMVAFYIPVIIMIIVNFRIYIAVKKLTERDRTICNGIASMAQAVAQFPGSCGLANNKYLSTTTPPVNSSPQQLPSLQQDDTVLSNPNAVASYESPLLDTPRSVSSSNRTPLLVSFNNRRRMVSSRLSSDGGSSSVSNRAQSASQEKKAAKNLTIIMGAFILCWLPFFVTTLLSAVCGPGCRFIPRWWHSMVLWLGYANSALNPVLVIAFNKDFKKSFSRLFARHCCLCFIKITGYSASNEFYTDYSTNYASSMKRPKSINV